MNRGLVRAAIEECIDNSDNRNDLVVALTKLTEAMWYDGQDAGKKYA